jgi:hypothetical protein
MEYIANRGIVPLPKGGLGNQIFIYIAAYIVSLKNKLPIYVFNNPVSNNKHNHNNLNYNNTLFKYIGTHINEDLSDTLRHKLVNNEYIMESNDDNAFKAWFPESVKAGTLMNTYYQYLPPIQEYETEIRTILLKGLAESVSLQKIDGSTTAFLHIRRGDYCIYSNIHYVQPLSYYIEAINLLLKLNKTIEKIYLMTDDIEWVKQHDFFKSILFNIIENKNELETFCIMTQCHGGAICANSTFSWWGAFLGAHSKKAPVIIPQRWINLPIVDLFPKEWYSI